MHEQNELHLAKWPFFFGDALLLGAGGFVFWESTRPMGLWQMVFVIVCAAGGACLSILPFLLEYRVWVKLAEARRLASVVEQLGELESLAAQISGATGQWQTAHEEAGKTTAAAQAIAERMGAEVKAFTDFMQQVNEGERATLRLEVDKLRRAESDWLQVLVRMLDHVYALYFAALRSGNTQLIDQLGHFQNACRDAARRVGLTPFLAAAAEPFDGQRHQVAEGKGAPPPGSVVAETVATGYTFQGRLLRPALVRLDKNGKEPASEKSAEQPQRALGL
jgi:molecular chaperone GrpE (heat shock protein)